MKYVELMCYLSEFIHYKKQFVSLASNVKVRIMIPL